MTAQSLSVELVEASKAQDFDKVQQVALQLGELPPEDVLTKSLDDLNSEDAMKKLLEGKLAPFEKKIKEDMNIQMWFHFDVDLSANDVCRHCASKNEMSNICVCFHKIE